MALKPIPNCLVIVLSVFLLISAVSCFYIKPLATGTITISDSDIRGNTVINKVIDLPFTEQYYKDHKDINITATITSLSMDQLLNFQFYYSIICPGDACQMNFTWMRYTQHVNPKFHYSMKIDYIVAHGLKLMFLNMTEFQNHIMMKHMHSFNEHNQPDNFGDNPPGSNYDAHLMLLLPNGFSNVTITGQVMYSYIVDADMYVIHYMDPEHGHGSFDDEGWQQGKQYVLYQALFVPKSYLDNDCIPRDNFMLTDHYQYFCNGDSNTKFFFSFKRTKEKEIEGEFFQMKSGYSFSVSKLPNRYGLMAFPFEAPDDFVDGREHEYKFEMEYRQIGVAMGVLIAAAVATAVAFIVYKVARKLLRRHGKDWHMFRDDRGTGTEMGF